MGCRIGLGGREHVANGLGRREFFRRLGTPRNLPLARVVQAAKRDASASTVTAGATPKVSIVDKTIDVLNTKTAPLVGAAGLLVLGAAVWSVGQRLLKLKREGNMGTTATRSSFSPSSSFTSSSSVSSAASSASDLALDQPMLFTELEAKMMSPLLLAAETAAEVDETSLMSLVELEDLEVTLRTLLSGMDAQLEELRYDVLEQDLVPADVLETMSDAVESDNESVWNDFQLIQPYIGDQERRSFRSLLYNRSVQLKLLDQVERQIGAKRDVGEGSENATERNANISSSHWGSADGGYASQLFYAAGATAPHARKKTKGGEDAFFTDALAMVIGIADGVGGWERLGVDPAAYSRKLMEECESVASMGNASSTQILKKGFDRTHVEGSCTAIIVKYLALEGRLDVVSVGDCSMRVVRDGEVVYRTEVQEHAWNQPYQLSHPPFNQADTPDDALEYSYDVLPGDIVVLGSDGLWDNLWDDELLMCISASDAMRKSYNGSDQWQQEAEELAQRLLELAEGNSLDESYASPFAEERESERRRSESFLTRLMTGMIDQAQDATGGKQDDITCVVAIVGGGET